MDGPPKDEESWNLPAIFPLSNLSAETELYQHEFYDELYIWFYIITIIMLHTVRKMSQQYLKHPFFLQECRAVGARMVVKLWRGGRLTGWWEFHPDKCSVIRITRKKAVCRYLYTLHGQILSEETNTKYLCVTKAVNMMWNIHIEQTATKGNMKLGFLKRNPKINNPDIKSRTLVLQDPGQTSSWLLQNSLGPTRS